ncbi:MAG: permease, partial [Gemmatimonadota bacterium]
MILLLACLGALWVGPLVYAATRSRPGVAAMIDGFLLATIAGTVLTSILPRILSSGDWLALGMLVLGFFVPGQV